jgi:hypothetical protein
MDQLKISDIKKLTKYIINNFAGERLQLREYVYNSLKRFQLVLDGSMSEENLLVSLCDEKGYNKFLKVLSEEISRTEQTTNKIYISKDENGLEYIELTNYGQSIHTGNKSIMHKKLIGLNQLEDKEKGDKYEEFCTAFLNDIGFQAFTTNSSNDAGVDVIGKLILLPKQKILRSFLGEREFSVIAQSKYQNEKVDQPIIRHLIADSLFLKFKPRTLVASQENFLVNNGAICLCVFSNSGFTNSAIDFAREYGIITFDTNSMIDLLCTLSNWENLYSVKLINNWN